MLLAMPMCWQECFRREWNLGHWVTSMATMYLFTTRLMLLVFCLPRVWVIVPVFVEVPGFPDSKPIDIWGTFARRLLDAQASSPHDISSFYLWRRARNIQMKRAPPCFFIWLQSKSCPFRMLVSAAKAVAAAAPRGTGRMRHLA